MSLPNDPVRISIPNGLPDAGIHRVGDALRHIRSVAREKESIYACYVMQPGTGALLGSLSLRDLVMSDLEASVTDVMRRKPITTDALEDQESVAGKIAKYNLLAVPVLEKDGSVVGFVTVDDVVDVLIEEGTEDILRLAGVEPGALDKPYFDTSFYFNKNPDLKAAFNAGRIKSPFQNFFFWGMAAGRIAARYRGPGRRAGADRSGVRLRSGRA